MLKKCCHAELFSAPVNKSRNRLVMLLLAILLFHPLFSSPANQVEEYTLENGLQVFLLEDPSDAQIHVEYSCRAGFSSQTQSTCGFFKLYTRLIQAANPKLNFIDAQCNSDSSRYFIETNASQINDILFALSDAFFSPDFSDELIKSQLEF